MSRLTLIKERLAVVDDVVPNSQLGDLGDILGEAGFMKIMAGERNDIWRENGSLNPDVRSIQIIWTEAEDLLPVLEKYDSVVLYPTKTTIDLILGAAKKAALEMQLWDPASTGDDEFVGVVAYFYKYAPGSRLVWHLDGSYFGGFAMYLTQLSQ